MRQGQKYNYNIVDIDLSAGLSDVLYEYEGEKITYLEGNSEIFIRLWDKSQDLIPLRPKHELVMPFNRFFITASASSETIKLLITNPASMQLDIKQVDVDNVNEIANIINAQSVDLVDEVTLIDKSITDYYRAQNDKNCFLWANGIQPATGEYAYVILENPSGSGKTLIVNRVMAIPNNPEAIVLCYATPPVFSLTSNIYNKYIGQSGSKALIGAKSNANLYGTQMAALHTNTFQEHEYLKHDAIIVPENTQLFVRGSGAGSSYVLYALFEWLEV